VERNLPRLLSKGLNSNSRKKKFDACTTKENLWKLSKNDKKHGRGRKSNRRKLRAGWSGETKKQTRATKTKKIKWLRPEWLIDSAQYKEQSDRINFDVVKIRSPRSFATGASLLYSFDRTCLDATDAQEVKDRALASHGHELRHRSYAENSRSCSPSLFLDPQAANVLHKEIPMHPLFVVVIPSSRSAPA
jgi:hypothetical protein